MPVLKGTETSGAGWVADIVESQLSSRNVIVPGVEHRDAPARAATMVRDVVGNALQVYPRLSFSLLQESADILFARNLLSVVEPGVIFSAVDVRHEEGGDASGFAMALAAALAVESQGKGSVGSGESDDKRHESELHSERNEKEFSCICGAHMKCSRVEEGYMYGCVTVQRLLRTPWCLILPPQFLQGPLLYLQGPESLPDLRLT